MKNKAHLKFCFRTAYEASEKRDAKIVMKDLAITYSHDTPQSIGDQYWFWNCENIPSPLPKYLEVLDIDPLDAVGFGLTEKEAKEIKEKQIKKGI